MSISLNPSIDYQQKIYDQIHLDLSDSSPETSEKLLQIALSSFSSSTPDQSIRLPNELSNLENSYNFPWDLGITRDEIAPFRNLVPFVVQSVLKEIQKKSRINYDEELVEAFLATSPTPEELHEYLCQRIKVGIGNALLIQLLKVWIDTQPSKDLIASTLYLALLTQSPSTISFQELKKDLAFWADESLLSEIKSSIDALEECNKNPPCPVEQSAVEELIEQWLSFNPSLQEIQAASALAFAVQAPEEIKWLLVEAWRKRSPLA